jgi:plasmid replication initiation protein
VSQIQINFHPIASDARSRDQQDLMSYPCFSLSKKKRIDIIRFEDGKGNFVEISPNIKHGMCTIWDFDIMLYFVSYIRHLIDNDQPIPTVFQVSGYDILKFCGRDTGKSQYTQLRNALQRLASTFVSTNIRKEKMQDDEVERRDKYLNFTWIANFTENTITRTSKTGKKKEITRSYEIQLPQWFVDGVVDSKLVLGINPAYFQITGGLERWLYRTARKFSGVTPNGARYTLDHLHRRSGSGSKYRDFKYKIKKLIEAGNIPDFHFTLYKARGKDWLHFQKKDQEKQQISLADELADFEIIAENPQN